MNENVRKFVPRAARYVLRPQDRTTMRFSLEDGHGKGAPIQQTMLINLSETGVAFLTDSAQGFGLGDHMMVEIPIPNGEQIAWWGKVVRIEEYEPRQWFFKKDPFFDHPKMIVGVRFDELPAGHSRALRKGIEKSFLKAMRDQRYRTWLYYRTFFLQHSLQIMSYIILTALAVGFIYYFSRP